MIYFKVGLLPGEDIRQALAKMKDASYHLPAGCGIQASFNGVTISAHPNTDIEKEVELYFKFQGAIAQ